MSVFGSGQQLGPLAFVVRTVITYVAMVALVRATGQREISQLTAVDFVVAITVGSILATPLADPETTLWIPLLTTAVFIGLRILNTALGMKNQFFARLTWGEPVVLVKGGRIQEQTMAKGLVTLDTMLEELRRQQVFDLADVDLAVLEPSGKINVRKRQQPSGTAKTSEPQRFPGLVLKEGRILRPNLEQAGLPETWLREQLAELGITDPRDVFVAQLSGDGRLYVDTYRDTAPSGKRDVSRDLIVSAFSRLARQFQALGRDHQEPAAEDFGRLTSLAAATAHRLAKVWGREGANDL